MSFVSSTNKSLWIKKKAEVLSSSTLVVDTVPMSMLKRAEYFFDMRRGDGTKVKSFQFSVTNVNGLLKDVVSSRSDNGLNVSIGANISLGNMEIELQNSELFDVEIIFVKLLL